MLAEREGASEHIRTDWETIREWLGMGEDQIRPTREQHEKFADGFLNYIHTGKAPSKRLRGAFIRIKNWLRELPEEIDSSSREDPCRRGLLQRRQSGGM
jgi:hypothetical protein